MQQPSIHIYNTLTRQTQVFHPIHPHHLTIYVCGPTVYGPAHLGHARSAISFDIVARTFKHLNYNITYVRNITDVGHLANDADEGEDKIGKVARLQKINPMQVAQKYITSYHNDMRMLNVLTPNIEPQASGHIIEQIAFIKTLLQNGYAYHVNGSVYFDITTYHKNHTYGILSGRKIEDLLSGTRELYQQKEKRNPLDFALWKKAAPEHFMQWSSPWSNGFPAWHLECSAMSTKYLGKRFDIHGGGLDLTFPHHECEIAQHIAAYGTQPANYWMHNNLVIIDSEKMSKSAGNFITLEQCFKGNHPLLSKPYHPLVLRFFILQAHYRSTLSFSDHALQAAEKGYYKLLNTYKSLLNIHHSTTENTDEESKLSDHIQELTNACYTALYQDFNTAKVLGLLFELSKHINTIANHSLSITQIKKEIWDAMKKMYTNLMQNILALTKPLDLNTTSLIEDLLVLYQEAKIAKNYSYVNKLRTILHKQGIVVQDTKHGIDWRYAY